MRGTRGGLVALVAGLALLAVVGNGGAKTAVPDLLFLDLRDERPFDETVTRVQPPE